MSCNVYADTGFENPELWLQKADLVCDIREAIRARGLSAARAARIVGMALPQFREMIKGHVSETELPTLVDCLRRLGHDVEISITPLAGDSPQPGRFTITSRLPRAL